ncbi:hypothetical protein IWX90DRAFT_267847 [Phyllosticta citrichinensis]|uniref:WW domain-containing protein n=1 Tax=Phyllosticta citrichinensis TaxID=1130410 RepID=A0ABR1XMN9_9PEZI
MAESKPAAPLSPDSGPTDSHLPKLPSGWIAQWDSSSRKYYYVQISTGVSQWELPTSEAPAGPSKRPEQIPPLESEAGQELTRGANGSAADYSGDRGLGSTALHLLAGQQHGKQSSGIGGLASSFLGGGSHGSSHAQSSSSHNSGTGGLVGQLASGLLGGSKPHAQQQSHGNSTSSHQSGLSGVLGGILGSSHSSSQQQQQQNYGYSSSGAPSGGYSGTAPPVQYTPGSSAGHTPSATGAYTPSGPQYPGQPGYNNHYPAASPQPSHAQYQAAPQSSSFGPGQPAQAYVPQGHNSFPPPPPQHQSYVASSANISAPTQTQFGQTTQHDHSQGGYFTQPSYGQAAYGNGQFQHQPAPVAPESYGTSTTHAAPPSYVQNASHSGFTQQAPQQAAYNPQSYGQPQQHNQYHATGAPPQPGW